MTFQAPVALGGLMQMLKPGGRLFVASPTNNHCGHGFCQFSPEFFYRAGVCYDLDRYHTDR